MACCEVASVAAQVFSGPRSSRRTASFTVVTRVPGRLAVACLIRRGTCYRAPHRLPMLMCERCVLGEVVVCPRKAGCAVGGSVGPAAADRARTSPAPGALGGYQRVRDRAGAAPARRADDAGRLWRAGARLHLQLDTAAVDQTASLRSAGGVCPHTRRRAALRAHAAAGRRLRLAVLLCAVRGGRLGRHAPGL